MPYIVHTASAQVKGRAKFGTYRNVAVVEVADAGIVPARINAKSVIRIVRHYGACSVGKTDRCQYARALAAAKALIESLDNEKQEAA